MTVTSPATDHHHRACDAIAASTPLLAEVMRRAPGHVRPHRMRWTNGEIAAHMYASVVEATRSVRGEPSAYDVEPTKELDEQMVAGVTERDPAVLADKIEAAYAEFLAFARVRQAKGAVKIPRGNVGTFVGLLALDHHLHGGQLAETAGTTWNGDVTGLHHPVTLVLPYVFDAHAARRFTGSFTLTLRGSDPVPYTVDRGTLRLAVDGTPDCALSADPQAFLRVGIGVTSQLRATLTGQVRATGRKPWLGLRVDKLFPPVPHGGVA